MLRFSHTVKVYAAIASQEEITRHELCINVYTPARQDYIHKLFCVFRFVIQKITWKINWELSTWEIAYQLHKTAVAEVLEIMNSQRLSRCRSSLQVQSAMRLMLAIDTAMLLAHPGQNLANPARSKRLSGRGL